MWCCVVMKAKFGHIHINVSDAGVSFPFYKEMLTLFDCKIWHNGKKSLGMGNGDIDFWITQAGKKHKKAGFHRKRVGLNHISFRVERKAVVDEFVRSFLKPRRIKPLYGSPTYWPKYSQKYYAVYFEDPDRIKLEVYCS